VRRALVCVQSSCLCDLIDDERDNQAIPPWHSHSDCVLSIAFRPAGSGSRNPGLPLQIATTGEDGRAKIWDCENGVLLHTLVHRDGTVLSCDWSGDGLMLATGHADGTVTLWDAQEGCMRRRYNARAGVLHVCWNRDGGRLAASTKAGTILVIDTRLPF
jgi:WD40 repeat protein